MPLSLWIRFVTARLLREERGASVVEYALLVGLIAIACFAAVQVFGTNLTERLQTSGSSIRG